MNFINYNGKILLSDTSIVGADNRGLRYGDGLFETIKYKNSTLILLDEHFARLWKGMQLMNFAIPKLFTADILQEQIIQLIHKNKLSAARIRINIFRGNGGLYDVKNHHPDYIIQATGMKEEISILNQNGLQVCIYEAAKKMIDAFSNIKHNNFLPYLMGAMHAKETQCNDAIILNNFDRICDSTIANIFVVKDKQVLTPALNEGCVAGVMRKYIIQQLHNTEYKVLETELTKSYLLQADEMFLSNSIYNMRWVAAIGKKCYHNDTSKKIFDFLAQTNDNVFC